VNQKTIVVLCRTAAFISAFHLLILSAGCCLWTCPPKPDDPPPPPEPVFEFTRIADTETIAPGQTSRFLEFYHPHPAMADGSVLFAGSTATPENNNGLYVYQEGGVLLVADRTTTMPNTSENFAVFLWATTGNGKFIFMANTKSQKYGIYVKDQDTLSVVVDENSLDPVDQEPYVGFDSTSAQIGRDAYTFSASDSKNRHSVYRQVNGKTEVMLNEKMLPANTPKPTRAFSGAYVIADTVAFSSVSYDGLYHVLYYYDGSNFVKVTDSDTPIPGQTNHFGRFNRKGLSGGNIAFLTSTMNAPYASRGIYAWIEKKLHVIAETGVLLPGVDEPVSAFNNTPAIEKEVVLFNATFSGDRSGLYFWKNGRVSKVLVPGDKLDGKTVISTNLGVDGIDGNQFAFSVKFENSMQAIYMGNYSE